MAKLGQGVRRLIVGLGGLLILCGLAVGATQLLGFGQPLIAGRAQAEAATSTPEPTATRLPTATPNPLATAAALGRPAEPLPLIQLLVPVRRALLPLGVFVVKTSVAPSTRAGFNTFSTDLGILNESADPVKFIASSQYKHAVSLYSGEDWIGLFLVGFRTAAGRDLLPTQGGGAAVLPPAVWGSAHLELELPRDETVSAITTGLNQSRMQAVPLTDATRELGSQVWAPDAAPTPLAVPTGTAVPAA